jgi:hypothetical protein
MTNHAINHLKDELASLNNSIENSRKTLIVREEEYQKAKQWHDKLFNMKSDIENAINLLEKEGN